MFFADCSLLDASARPRQPGGGLYAPSPKRFGASATWSSPDNAKRREIKVGGRRILTVDVHAHCYPDIRDLIKDHAEPVAANGGPGSFDVPVLNPTNVQARLRHMDEHGIDYQAVSLAPAYNYWADRDLAARIVERQNEQIAALCASHPDRFVGLGGLALQHPDLAVEQMEIGVKKLGMRGFEIGGSVNGEELSAPKFEPFWAKAEELGVLILIHPAGFTEAQKRLQGNGFLPNVIGNPLETTVALSHLIFEGTLDRYPGLKICGSHGGGYLASYSGRADHCVELSARCKPVKKHPREYFKQQLYCDTIVFSAEGLRHLVAEVGASHVLLGSDFPFDITDPYMGDPREADSVLGVAGVSAADQVAILGANAAKLLGIKS
jgi:aminocarboxymuconate-semialdehyde decarboxylase